MKLNEKYKIIDFGRLCDNAKTMAISFLLHTLLGIYDLP